MSEPLTRKMLDDFFEKVVAESEQPPSIPVIHRHPLEYPFYDAIFNWHVDSIDKVMRLKNQCFRKWVMGDKRGIEKWSLNNLIADYTAKLERLRVQDSTPMEPTSKSQPKRRTEEA